MEFGKRKGYEGDFISQATDVDPRNPENNMLGIEFRVGGSQQVYYALIPDNKNVRRKNLEEFVTEKMQKHFGTTRISLLRQQDPSGQGSE